VVAIIERDLQWGPTAPPAARQIDLGDLQRATLHVPPFQHRTYGRLDRADGGGPVHSVVREARGDTRGGRYRPCTGVHEVLSAH
jgi:hypothetical protein